MAEMSSETCSRVVIPMIEIVESRRERRRRDLDILHTWIGWTEVEELNGADGRARGLDTGWARAADSSVVAWDMCLDEDSAKSLVIDSELDEGLVYCWIMLDKPWSSEDNIVSTNWSNVESMVARMKQRASCGRDFKSCGARDVSTKNGSIIGNNCWDSVADVDCRDVVLLDEPRMNQREVGSTVEKSLDLDGTSSDGQGDREKE
ncbi:unnamed protein product [Cutaneotrichosporon oleaginosum]